jgi:hypothetical protein
MFGQRVGIDFGSVDSAKSDSDDSDPAIVTTPPD